MSRTLQSRTKTSTRNEYERGRETIVEKIGGMEGDDMSDSDLDIINVVTKEVDADHTDRYIKGLSIAPFRTLLSLHTHSSSRITGIRDRS